MHDPPHIDAALGEALRVPRKHGHILGDQQGQVASCGFPDQFLERPKKKDQRATMTDPPGVKAKPQSLLAPAPTTLHLTLDSSTWTPASTWASSPTDYLAVRKYSSLSWPQFSHLLNGNDAPCSFSSHVCIYVRAACSREHTCVDVDGSRRQPQASFPVPREPSPCWGFSFVFAAVCLFAGDGTLPDPTGLELTDDARLPGS